MDLKEFGRELKNLRIKANKTMGEAAEFFGVSVPHYLHMENGRQTAEMRGVRQVLEGIRNLKNWMKDNGLSDEEIRGIVGPVEEYITEILLYSGMSCK